MTLEVPIPYNFTPRDYQLPLLQALDSGYRNCLWIVHRRAGKDITALNYTIRQMVEHPGVYYYIFPEYAQAKKVIWDSMRNDGFRILDHFHPGLIERSNSQEMKIRFKNGSLFQLIGSDKYDALMGTNPIGCVYSEFATQDPRAYDYMSPIQTANKGWAIIVSTPRGKNHMWELYSRVKKSKDWWVQVLTIDDTKAITEEDIEGDREKGMSEEMVQQEYYCSFEKGIDGAYYAKILAKLSSDGHIRNVNYDQYTKVHTAWDIGFGDSTAIWWYQLIPGGEIHVVDYYEDHAKGLPHYVGILEQKRLEHGFIYGSHYFPHDMASTEFGTGKSRVGIATSLGVPPVLLPKQSKLEDGIELVRKWLPKCYFDEKRCAIGIKNLENYQKRYDDKLKRYNDTPLHNFASHGADAFRYLCTAAETHGGGSDYDVSRHRELKRKFGRATGEEPRSKLGGIFD